MRRAIRSAGAKLFLLPKYSPDLNPIEKFFAKLKHWLRKAARRTVETVCDAIVPSGIICRCPELSRAAEVVCGVVSALVQKPKHIAAARHAPKRGLYPGKTNAAEAAGTGSAILEEMAKRAKGGVLPVGGVGTRAVRNRTRPLSTKDSNILVV